MIDLGYYMYIRSNDNTLIIIAVQCCKQVIFNIYNDGKKIQFATFKTESLKYTAVFTEKITHLSN